MGDMAFEHRMYLPLVAPICWMVVLIYRAASAVVERVGINERATMSVWSVVVALLLASAVWLTLCRNADYHSEIALWQDVVAKRPNNCRAQSTLTIALLREQRFTEAEVSARSLLDTLNRLEKGQEGAFRFSERMAVYYRHLALNGLGQSFLGQGRMDLAADCFRKQEEAGGNARSAYDLARILYLLDREEESLNFCELTLKRDPKFGRAYVLKGCLLERRQQYNEAAACYRKALALIPNDASAECRLAWLLATCPDDAVRDAEEAVVLAQAVCRQTGGYNGRVFDILAAAYAEKGDIAAAVRTQEKAVKMATESLEDSRKRGISLPESLEEALVGGVPLKDMMYRLDLYRQGKPYRDER
jgi:tetratricopeptide (TPR) repeat protein